MSPIVKEIQRPPRQSVAELARFPVAILADALGRRGTADSRIKAVNRCGVIAGPAVTVEVRPGDNLMLQAALQLAQPGDVLVVDGKGAMHCALAGGLMVAQARALGLRGMMIDGAIRDTAELSLIDDFGVFAAGTHPNGPSKSLAGRINWPIALGGMTVRPGDVVVGDEDGIVCIEQHSIELVLAAAAACLEKERAIHRSFQSGHLRPAWVVDALRTVELLGPAEGL